MGARAESDAELIEGFRRGGSPGDLLPLYRRYAEFIYLTCLRYLGTPERAEDAGAEVFEVLLEKLPNHRVDNFRGWLATLLRNHCLMKLRAEKRDPLALSGDADVQSERFEHPFSEGAADTRPLYRCLKTLKAEQRECIRLFYLTEGESYASIAERMHLSVGRVRSHIQNGRRNLRRCLETAPQPTGDDPYHA